ncbi:MAG: hypothetical protein O7A63_04485 [Acidobacteria bacterium]|nr:hypothetical protein [Acidobacteriota bacterium]
MKIDSDESRILHCRGARRQAGAVKIVVVVGGVILIALVAYGLYRMGAAPSEGAIDLPVEVAVPVTPFTGIPITASAPAALSPQARVAVERYRCVCGCDDRLGECTCKQTPGSIDMKEHLQDLVNRGLTMTQIDEGMVAQYGDQALLSNPPTVGDAPDPAP